MLIPLSKPQCFYCCASQQLKGNERIANNLREYELMNIHVFTIDVLKVYGYIGTQVCIYVLSTKYKKMTLITY